MNMNLVEARSPLRATFVSGERTRAPPPEVHGSNAFQNEKEAFREPGRDAFHRTRVQLTFLETLFQPQIYWLFCGKDLLATSASRPPKS